MFLFTLISLPEVTKWLIIGILAVYVFYILAVIIGRKAIVRSVIWKDSSVTAHLYYYLPKGLIKIASTVKVEVSKDDTGNVVGAKIVEQTFLHQRLLAPDSSARFGLKYISNAFSSDELTFKINPQGLLESVNILAEDRLPVIVESISAAPAVIFAPAVAAREALAALADTEIIEFSREFILDPFAQTTVPWILEIPNSILKVHADFALVNESGNNVGQCEYGIDENGFDGIIIRPVSSVSLRIELKSNQGLASMGAAFVENLPDNNACVKVPLSRTQYVKVQNDLTLVDGVLSTNVIKKPSEIEALVKMPINVIKAIVAIPAQLISFKFDNTKKQNELEMEKQKLQATITTGQRNELIRQLETSKHLLEAQKNLIDARAEIEKSKLTIEKELQQLKNDIEKFKKPPQ